MFLIYFFFSIGIHHITSSLQPFCIRRRAPHVCLYISRRGSGSSCNKLNIKQTESSAASVRVAFKTPTNTSADAINLTSRPAPQWDYGAFAAPPPTPVEPTSGLLSVVGRHFDQEELPVVTMPLWLFEWSVPYFLHPCGWKTSCCPVAADVLMSDQSVIGGRVLTSDSEPLKELYRHCPHFPPGLDRHGDWGGEVD